MVWAVWMLLRCVCCGATNSPTIHQSTIQPNQTQPIPQMNQCAGDQLNVGRTGKVVKASGQNVDVSFAKGGLDIVITFKKTDLARAPPEVAAAVAKAKAPPKEKKKKWTKADERNLKLLGDEMARGGGGGQAVTFKGACCFGRCVGGGAC